MDGGGDYDFSKHYKRQKNNHDIRRKTVRNAATYQERASGRDGSERGAFRS